MIITISGSRPQKYNKIVKDNPENKIKQLIKKAISEEEKIELCYIGMALGVDQLACEVCLGLKIPYVATIPFEDFNLKWSKDQKQHYDFLLSKAERIEVVCDSGYAAWKLQKRNEYMIDRSNKLLVFYDGLPGGSQNALDYAIKNKIETKAFSLLEIS